MLVFGGTGFIGRELIRQLLAANYCVRAVIHRSGSVLEEIDSDHLEIVRGDMSSKADLERFISGIDFVFHLGRANAQTWDDYLQRDVEPTRIIADACLKEFQSQEVDLYRNDRFVLYRFRCWDDH